MSSIKERDFLLGVYDDEDLLVEAVGKVRSAGIKIYECYTPFPVHGLDAALGYKPSNLPIAAFIFGLTGTCLALTMQIWMLGFDFPNDIGGKPYIGIPAFIPVTFELTVLISALGMVATFLIVSKLKPYKLPEMLDIRTTDDKFLLAVDMNNNKTSRENIQKLMRDTGAVEVNEKVIKY